MLLGGCLLFVGSLYRVTFGSVLVGELKVWNRLFMAGGVKHLSIFVVQIRVRPDKILTCHSICLFLHMWTLGHWARVF